MVIESLFTYRWSLYTLIVLALIGAVTVGVLLLRWANNLSRRARDDRGFEGNNGIGRFDMWGGWVRRRRRDLEGAVRLLTQKVTLHGLPFSRKSSDRTVVILRGVPGAGKSTYARRTFPTAKVVSTDAHHTLRFLSPTAVEDVWRLRACYEYSSSLVEAAYSWCFLEFLTSLLQEVPLVVVDNASIAAWEIAPYVLAGRAFGYAVEIVTLTCPVDVAVARNVHGTEADVVRKRAAELEQTVLPPHWLHRVLEYPAYESSSEEPHGR